MYCKTNKQEKESGKRLLWIIPQHNILPLAVTRDNFSSPASNSLQFICFPSHVWKLYQISLTIICPICPQMHNI